MKNLGNLKDMANLMDLVEDAYIEEAAQAIMKGSGVAAAGDRAAAGGDGADATKGGATACGDGVAAAGGSAAAAGSKAVRKNLQKNAWKKWLAMAACLCIVVTGAAAWGANVFFTDNPGRTDGRGQADASAVGVAIPAVKLPEETDGIAMDMVAMVVYQGNVYMDSGDSYSGEDAEAIYGLVGQCVGYGAGNIDEWSTKDDDETEVTGEGPELPGLASTVSGKVYQVKGYDPNFRLCMLEEFEYESEEGMVTVPGIYFLERLNGITVNTGEDVFGDRLHLKENGISVEQTDHQTWFNWAYENGEDVPKEALEISDEDWNSFLDEVYAGKFEDLTGTDIYDRIAVHLYVHMKDQTVVHLRVSEDGYVLYEGLPWYGVKVSGAGLEQIFALG